MIPAIPVERSAQSRVEIQNQVLAYAVPLPATPFTLHYRSDQVPGNAASPAIVIPLAPRKPSKRLKQVVVEMECGGQSVRKTFDPSVRAWRHVVEELPAAAGPAPAIRIRVGQVLRASFPMPEMTKWREHTLPLRPPDARSSGLGGWTIDVHHRFDPLARVIHFGNGTRQRLRAQEIRTEKKSGEVTIDPGSDGFLLVFDEHGRHRRTIDSLTGAIQLEFAYGSSSELTAIIDAAENETRIERRPERRQITILAPAGEGLELRLDERGYLSGLTTPAGRKTSFAHSEGGLLRSVVLPEGRRDAFEYDEAGRLVSVQEGGRTSQLVARDEGNRKTVALIDDRGGEMVIDREVAESGETLRTSRCCGGIEIRSVKRPDGSEEISYPDGIRVVIEETAAARVAKTILPSRKVYEVRLKRGKNAKQLVETAEVNGRRFETMRDAAKRVVTSTTPEGRKTVAEFDTQGRLTRYSRWSGALVERRWDRKGKLVEITEQSADERRVWKLSHDEAGRLSEVRDPAGRQTRLEFDLDDRLVRFAAPGGEVSYAYADGAGVQIITPAAGRLPLVAGTILDQPGVEVISQRPDVISEVRIGSSWRTFTYAPSGRVAGLRSSDGIDIDIERDGALITAVRYSGKVQGEIGREFDRDQQLVADDVNGAHRAEYRYDRDGLMVQAGKLTIERDAKTGDIVRKRIGRVEIAHAWNGFGDLRELRYTTGDTELFALSQRHDALGRVVEKFERIAGAMRQRAYTYDAAGRLAAIASGGKTVSRFAYDANGNLTRAEHDGKTIDARYDSRDRILDAGGVRYEHGERGELASAQSAAGTTRYEYDPFGPLRGVTLPDGRTAAWLFDALGRPCQKLVGGRAAQTFLFDHQHRVLAQIDGDGVTSRFVWGTRSNVPEYIESDGKTLLLVCDGIGTPRLLVDVDSGTIVQRLEIDELGLLSGDADASQPFGFAGGIYDPLSGLTRFGARHYDPRTGRWTQPDPIGYAAGTNLYEYVGGDPINRIDPQGLSPEGEGGGTVNFYGDGKPVFTPKDPLVPSEAGQTPVDNLNPKEPAFDFTKWLFNPKDPGPNPGGLPGKPNKPGGIDFNFRGARCVASGQNRTRYGQDDTGGLPRDSYSGLPGNQYDVTPGTVGGGIGVRF